MNTQEPEWSEALQVEVMEDYLHLAEMRHLAKDPVAHMEKMREHWQKLQDFIHHQLQKAREEEREKVKAMVQEISGQMYFDYGGLRAYIKDHSELDQDAKAPYTQACGHSVDYIVYAIHGNEKGYCRACR